MSAPPQAGLSFNSLRDHLKEHHALPLRLLVIDLLLAQALDEQMSSEISKHVERARALLQDVHSDIIEHGWTVREP